MVNMSSGKGNCMDGTGYSESLMDLNQWLVVNAGVSVRYFALNHNLSVEPMLSLKWKIGQSQSVIFQGGDRYTPIDADASLKDHEIVFNEADSYTLQYKPALNGDLTINYRINQPKVSHEISLKILNLGGYAGQHGYFYNEQQGVIVRQNVQGSLTNLSYKIEF